MSYINVSFNHFRAIQRWAAATGARATLDATNFQLEVKHRNRYFILFPQFIALTEARLSHVPTLVDGVFGFAGWLPYRPYSLELSTDKLLFKKFFADAGLRTPAMWASAADAERDFILKRSRGSFGAQLAGPFRVEQRSSAHDERVEVGAGTLFAEEFIPGTILKAWYWGHRPFFAHAEHYLDVAGDGERDIDELARARMNIAVGSWAGSSERAGATACVAYQGTAMSHVPKVGSRAWIDFRYGQALRGMRGTARTDNAFDALGDVAKDQIRLAGERAQTVLRAALPAPVAFTLDGIIDADGNVWWLEMNSNPVFPPEGYAEMFADLFA